MLIKHQKKLLILWDRIAYDKNIAMLGRLSIHNHEGIPSFFFIDYGVIRWKRREDISYGYSINVNIPTYVGGLLC